jgi:hypothetical protein
LDDVLALVVHAVVLAVAVEGVCVVDCSRVVVVEGRSDDSLMSSFFSISWNEEASTVVARSQDGSPVAHNALVARVSPMSPRACDRGRIMSRSPRIRCDSVRDIDITSAVTQTRSLLYSALDQIVMNSAVSSIAPICELILLTPQGHGAERCSIAITIPQYTLPDACPISFDLFLTGFYSTILMSDAIELSVNFVTIPSISAVSPQVHRDSIDLSPERQKSETINFDDALPFSSLISDLSSIIILDEIRIVTNFIHFNTRFVNDHRVSGRREYNYDFEPIFTPIVHASIVTVFMEIPSTIDLSRLMFIGTDPDASAVLSRSQPAAPAAPVALAPHVPPPSDGRSRVTFFRAPSVPGNYHNFDIRWSMLSTISSLKAVSELVRHLFDFMIPSVPLMFFRPMGFVACAGR